MSRFSIRWFSQSFNCSSTLIAMALLAGACVTSTSHAKRPKAVVGQFDYYAMALSWSPSYCAGHTDPNQCAPGRGLGFVLHGLWPQFEHGYPQSCSNQPLPDAVRSQYASLFPSPKLIKHEWDKHGTCSGLDPAAYFALSAKLKSALVIPPAYVRPAAPVRVTYSEFAGAFASANASNVPDAVIPFCTDGGRFLREVHACFATDGRTRSCSAAEVKRSRNSCRQASFLLQSVR